MQYATPQHWLHKANLLLAEAERRYFGRDLNYEFIGVHLDANGPNIRFTPDYSGISIELSPSAMQYPDQALHQIAHEVIHLLAPVRNPPANLLEEGLAVHFSIYGPEYSDPHYRNDARKWIETRDDAKNFRDALHYFEELTGIEPDAISKLRAIEKDFFSMDANLIRSVNPLVSEDLAKRLCERRQMR